MSSAAHTAALEGDVELLKSALEADPEGVVRRYGPAKPTLLMPASAHGHVATVSCLLDAGADPNAVNGNGETALIFAASFRWPDVVRVLTAAGAEVDYRDALGMTAARPPDDGSTLHRTAPAEVRPAGPERNRHLVDENRSS